MNEPQRKLEVGPSGGAMLALANFPVQGRTYITLDDRLPGRIVDLETLENMIDCLSHARDIMQGLTTDVFIAPAEGPTTVAPLQNGVVQGALRQAGFEARPLAGPRVQSEAQQQRVAAANGGYCGRVFVLCTENTVYQSWKAQHGLTGDPRLEYIARYDGFTRIQGYDGPRVNRYVIVGQEAPWMSAWTKRMSQQGFGEMTPAEVIALLKGE